MLSLEIDGLSPEIIKMNLRIEEEEGEGAMRGIGGFPLIPPLLKEGNTSSTTKVPKYAFAVVEIM